MNKPLLVVVTGRPASGKSTLAHILAKEIKCPLLSRDELKEGYINTLGLSHSQVDNSVAQHIYNTFFEAIELFIAKDISLIVEAAFQDKLWKPKLLDLLHKVTIRIVICTTTADVAKSRFTHRLQNDPGREKFHGDHLVKEQGGLLTSDYDPVKINVPILEVDTTKSYNPDLEKIIGFIKQENSL